MKCSRALAPTLPPGACSAQVGRHAVVIEADAIKNSDAVYMELSRNELFRGDPSISCLVHEYSTRVSQLSACPTKTGTWDGRAVINW